MESLIPFTIGGFLFGLSPLMAAGAVFKMMGYFKHSVPMQAAVLDTITNPKPTAQLLKDQFSNLTTASIGSTWHSGKRILVSLGLIVTWTLILGAAKYALPDSFLGFVAKYYFDFLSFSPETGFSSSPGTALVLVILTVLLLQICISTYSALLTFVLFRQSSLAINLALLLFVYALYVFIAHSFAAACTIAYFAAVKGASIFNPSVAFLIAKVGALSLGEAFTQPLVILRDAIGSVQLIFSRFTSEDLFGVGLLAGVNDTLFRLSNLAIFAMLLTSIFTLSIPILAYFVGLLLVRMDLFLRGRFGFDQKVILASPIEHLARVVALTSAILVLLLNGIAYTIYTISS